MENPLEKATFTGHEYHKHGGRRSIAGIKESLKEIPLNLNFLNFEQKMKSPPILQEGNPF